MQIFTVPRGVMVALACATSLLASAQTPKVDLSVEWRQVSDASAGPDGYTVSTHSREPQVAIQRVQVRNGERATFKIGQTQHVQWVQSMQMDSSKIMFQRSSAAAGSAASMSQQSVGVTQAVMPLESGQSITVQPRWGGGRQAAVVQVEVNTAAVVERPNQPLPAQDRTQVVTSVNAPLGQWVTIATSGKGATPRGTYSTGTAEQGVKRMQIRVTAAN